MKISYIFKIEDYFAGKYTAKEDQRLINTIHKVIHSNTKYQKITKVTTKEEEEVLYMNRQKCKNHIM